MNKHAFDETQDAHLTMRYRIERLCDSFQQAWKANKQPRIENYLTDCEEPEYSDRLRKLITLEVALRRGRPGEELRFDEFAVRFPQHTDLLANVLMTNQLAETVSFAAADVDFTSRFDPRQTGKVKRLTIEQFRKALTESDLIAEKDVEAICASLPPERQSDPNYLAHELIRQKKLTTFQAQAFFQRKSKSLRFGKYTVLEQIGRGGMGVVLKAEHQSMKRVVALKILPVSLLRDQDAIKRFRREVEAAAKLMHSNIVSALDAGEQRGMKYLVMEYIDGRDLEGVLKDSGPLSVDKALEIMIQVSHGLEYAHHQGVVHRDIKPNNLLITKEGEVKILDMGLARLLSDGLGNAPAPSVMHLTETGQIMGTVDYMSPEQAEDTRCADQRSDIYSLGCTLYRLLTGESPYRGDTMMKRLLAHREAAVPSLRTKRPDVSIELDTMFQRMVAKHPDDRPQSMREVTSELQMCLSSAERAEGLLADKSKDGAMNEIFGGLDIDTTTSLPNENVETIDRQDKLESYLNALRFESNASPTAKNSVGGPFLWVAIGAGGLLVLVILLLVVILIISSADKPTIGEIENKDPDSPSTSKNDVEVSDGDVKKRVLPAEKIENLTAPPNPVKSSTSDSSKTKPIKPIPTKNKPTTNVAESKPPKNKPPVLAKVTKTKPPPKNNPPKTGPPPKATSLGFVPLKPEKFSSSSGLAGDLLPDHSVSVQEKATADEVYTIRVKTDLQEITALRLEALPFKDQAEQGPGHGRGGDFTIKSFAVAPAPVGSQIPLAGVFSNEQDGAHRMLMPGMFWAAKGKRTSVTLTFQSPTAANVSALEVTITQRARENLGLFRLSATTNLEWLGVRLPLAVNLGGPAFRKGDLHWETSKPYAKDSTMFGHEGGKHETDEGGSQKVANTSCILGIQAFRAALPKGKYDVELEFCQRWSRKRDGTFSITLEGKQTKPKFNVYELAGDFNKPYVETFKNVDVNDGVLDVEFKKGTEDPLLNSIVIRNARKTD